MESQLSTSVMFMNIRISANVIVTHLWAICSALNQSHKPQQNHFDCMKRRKGEEKGECRRAETWPSEKDDRERVKMTAEDDKKKRQRTRPEDDGANGPDRVMQASELAMASCSCITALSVVWYLASPCTVRSRASRT